MGYFHLGKENGGTHLINDTTDWKNDGLRFIALVEGAQLTTLDGITLTFKQGSILSLIKSSGFCVYSDDDLP